MRVPYTWLAEWVDVPWQGAELGSRLTMAGFELEALETAAPPFTHVIVAEIVEAVRHPQADKLQVCKVAVGSGEPVQIVSRRAECAGGLEECARDSGREAAGRSQHQGGEAARCGVVRDAVLGERAGALGCFERHRRVAGGCAGGAVAA